MSSKRKFKPLNLNNQSIEEWFKKIKDLKAFPFEFDYPTQYSAISNALNAWVHPYVNSGAMMTDKGYLTDHGPKHIQMLIRRVSQFLDGNPNDKLSNTEVLVLLLAIHIHDVGNILGRNNHEVNAQVIIDKIGQGIAGQDRLLWDNVYPIAKAHKDSVIQKDLVSSEWIHGQQIRPQLLAALVKFADELAEDSSRADRFNIFIENKKMPEGAKLYHQYALALTTLMPHTSRRYIEMIYHIDENLLKQKFKKKVKNKDKEEIEIEVHIIDEIYLRVLKTHYERLYCMRFLRPFINFDSIKVSINIKYNDGRRIINSFELVESGIEDINMDEVFKMCPELKEKTGNHYYEDLLKNQE